MLYFSAKFSAVTPIGVTTGTRSVKAAAKESSNLRSIPYRLPNLEAPARVSKYDKVSGNEREKKGHYNVQGAIDILSAPPVRTT